MPTLPVPLNVISDQQNVLKQYPENGLQPSPLPVANPTRSFWLQLENFYEDPDSSHGPRSPSLMTDGSVEPLTADADICIVGSGISGVSAAYHLARKLEAAQESHTYSQADGHAEDTAMKSGPVTAIILEAREFCSGATGRNGGHLTAALYEGFTHNSSLHGSDDALREYALQKYTVSELTQLVSLHESRVSFTEARRSVDLIAGGHVELFFTEREYECARTDYEAAKAAGADLHEVEWLNREETEVKYGAGYPAVRIPGNNLRPYQVVQLLYELAQAATPNFALNIHTRTPVTSIVPCEDETGRRWSLTTPRGAISCSYVIHATNAYVSHLLPHMAGPDGVIPTRGQVMAIRAAAPLSEVTKVGWSGNEGFEYWFPRPLTHPSISDHSEGDDQRPVVILGGGREAMMPSYELYEADDSTVDKKVGEAMRKFLPAVFPGKYEIGREPEMEWTGIMGFTKTGDPFVGPVKFASGKTLEGQFISAGFSGHGMPRAFACAEVVAGMVVCDMRGETWAVPEWLPLHYLTTERK